jgi:hypothetical protein
VGAIRQTSFAAGELAPALRGRTDLQKWSQGLRRCRDFFISKQGAAVSRPGTVGVAVTKYGASFSESRYVRLLPFVYSDTQSYVLEVGIGYIRFHSDGAVVTWSVVPYDGLQAAFTVGATVEGFESGATGVIVADSGTALTLRNVAGTFDQSQEELNDSSGGRANSNGATTTTPVEYATPYVAADMFSLQWAQSGDVLTICHKDHPPAELSRIAHDNWTYAACVFTRPSAFQSATDVFLSTTSLGAEDVANGIIKRAWTYAVTLIVRVDATGYVYETAPTTLTKSSDTAAGSNLVDIPETLCVYPSSPVTVWIPADGVPAFGGSTVIGARVYRGRAALLGWIGDVGGDTHPLGGSDLSFIDVGMEPDYAMAPPQGKVPFVAGEYPSAVTYFEERLWFGGTTARPAFLFGSATADYHNFDDRMVPVATEALTYELAGRKREDVKSLAGLDQLLIGTGMSAWAFGGSGGEPLAPEVQPRAKVQVEVGCRALPFLVVGQSALFCRNKGGGVRSLVPGGQGGWQSGDLSTIAQHFFTGTDYDIVDWTYAEDPWGLIWLVRADGALLSLTYSEPDQMWAWALHTPAGGGLAKSVCAVPEGDEDAVYVVVERNTSTDGGTSIFRGTFIERMASRIRYGLVTDDICLDGAIRYEGTPTVSLSGLDKFEGQSVYVVGKSNPVQGPFTVSAGAVTLLDLPIANQGNNVVLYAGLLYQPELETLNAGGGTHQRTTKSVAVEVFESIGFSIGQDFTEKNLRPWRQRTVSAGYGAIEASTETVRLSVTGTWSEHGRVAIRQTQPLPLTIVGVTRDVESGE